MRSKNIYSIFMLISCLSLMAQDPQFTQFYASPLYLNPAFTGLTYEHRFALNYRNQWPGINTAYTTYMASYDYNLSNINSGIGAYSWQDRAGSSNLVTTQFGINYAYRVKIDKYSEARAGLMMGMTQKKIDFSGLIFNDQLTNSTGVSREAGNQPKINYLDMGVGGLFNSTNYWVGIAAKHINQPNISMVGNVEALPVSLSIHGGYRYIITARGAGKTKLEEFVSASMNYRRELKYDQFDIGAYYYKNILTFGLWYRGLPFKHYKPGYGNRESVAVLLGLEIPDKNLRIGYSFDITVSRLGLNKTYGAHEISLVYEVAKKRKRNKRVLVSCPKF